jgi:hypothetical protein
MFQIEAPVLLRAVKLDVLGVTVFEMCSCNTQADFTVAPLDENFSCHTPGLTHINTSAASQMG